MIYLSRMNLNPRSRQARKELNDPYQMHRTLSKAFGDDQSYREARLLFRVEEPQPPKPLCVLVQTLLAPDWQSVGGGDYWLGEPQTKSFDPDFREGQRFYFRLRANPTQRVQGRRLGLYKEDEAEQWLLRQAHNHGFQILQSRVAPIAKTTAKNGQGTQSTFCVARFDGLLRVSDESKFLDALRGGIGSGKGYGFGLLTLAVHK